MGCILKILPTTILVLQVVETTPYTEGRGARDIESVDAVMSGLVK
jgi:hypothetical protein